MDNYDDSPPQGQQPAAPAQDDGQGQDNGKTCLLPKSAFPDAKPGDSLSVQVVAVHGDEIEVTPDNDDGDQGDQDQDEGGQAAPAAAPSGEDNYQ